MRTFPGAAVRYGPCTSGVLSMILLILWMMQELLHCSFGMEEEYCILQLGTVMKEGINGALHTESMPTGEFLCGPGKAV